ncbi:MAG: hypothetical protein R3B98_04450 [Hyphomonas sp.]
MSDNADMTGFWSGEYRYYGADFVVRFSASLTESGHRLTGTTLEPATFGDTFPLPEEYEAYIKGDRVGQHLWFSKRYDPSSGIAQPPVLYSGAVNPAFTLVTGRWAFPDTSRVHGTFTLTRVETTVAAALRQATTAT